ncbi:hypothetical protein TSUD_383160 [Trifolium subterraneum]|uniref:Uncharacterized protein n=1 Tax=Trifolium subterraneum TaxID=3900 RepID=A0A2Z6LNE7_TRISU|nr:hypothetical protein TSUD_383160 [Trifolium subterraneum]
MDPTYFCSCAYNDSSATTQPRLDSVCHWWLMNRRERIVNSSHCSCLIDPPSLDILAREGINTIQFENMQPVGVSLLGTTWIRKWYPYVSTLSDI